MFRESRTSRTELSEVHPISLKSKEDDRCRGPLSFSHYAGWCVASLLHPRRKGSRRSLYVRIEVRHLIDGRSQAIEVIGKIQKEARPNTQ